MWTRLAALTPPFVLRGVGLVVVDVVVVTGGGGVLVVVVTGVVATAAGKLHDSEPVTGSTYAGTRLSASYGYSLSSPLTRSYVLPVASQ